jgi:hypothetical protein
VVAESRVAVRRRGVGDLAVVVHPAGELDDAVAQRLDVDGALAQHRVVGEDLEHARAEFLVAGVVPDDLVLEVFVQVVGEVGRGRDGCGVRPAAPPHARGEAAGAAHALGEEHPDGEPGGGADGRAQDHGGRGTRVAGAGHASHPCGEGDGGTIA